MVKRPGSGALHCTAPQQHLITAAATATSATTATRTSKHPNKQQASNNCPLNGATENPPRLALAKQFK